MSEIADYSCTKRDNLCSLLKKSIYNRTLCTSRFLESFSIWIH